MRILRSAIAPAAVGAALLVSGCEGSGADAEGEDVEVPVEVDETDPNDEQAAEPEPQEPAGEEPAGEPAGSGSGSDHPFPELPDEFPLPDEHLIMRSNTHEGEPMGYSLEVVLMADGTLEEQIAFYEESLADVYGEVEIFEHGDGGHSHRVFFSGPDFGHGGVTLDENAGHLDTDEVDTSHLPVYIHVAFEENPRD